MVGVKASNVWGSEMCGASHSEQIEIYIVTIFTSKIEIPQMKLCV